MYSRYPGPLQTMNTVGKLIIYDSLDFILPYMEETELDSHIICNMNRKFTCFEIALGNTYIIHIIFTTMSDYL